MTIAFHLNAVGRGQQNVHTRASACPPASNILPHSNASIGRQRSSNVGQSCVAMLDIAGTEGYA